MENLKQYTTSQLNGKFESVLKDVPLDSNYDKVRHLVHAKCKLLVNNSSFVDIKPRFVFRGPRKRNPLATNKNEANAFDVYLKIETSPVLSFSNKRKQEIKSIAKEQFQTLVW